MIDKSCMILSQCHLSRKNNIQTTLASSSG
uniref:Uncharacterized protein n=1 Tax=Rhizophora mucronata TaxID=61149 RepID=A0A2P2MX66_RHIMU